MLNCNRILLYLFRFHFLYGEFYIFHEKLVCSVGPIAFTQRIGPLIMVFINKMLNIPSEVVKFLHEFSMQLFTIFIDITKFFSWHDIIICAVQQLIVIFQFVEYYPFLYHVSHFRLDIMIENFHDSVIPYIT